MAGTVTVTANTTTTVATTPTASTVTTPPPGANVGVDPATILPKTGAATGMLTTLGGAILALGLTGRHLGRSRSSNPTRR
jgi:LPXTG-motif cell wall-anchored protein